MGPPPSRPPALLRAIPDQVIGVGETATLDASSHFSDPDGGALTYEASSSDPTVATAANSGSTVTIAALEKGSARITIAVTDPSGLGNTQSFQVMVPNRSPAALAAVPDQTVFVNETAALDAALHFNDPDGDTLSFRASSSDPSVVGTSLAGSVVTITAPEKGASEITITASDPSGLTASQAFQVTIPNRPPEPLAAVPDQTVHIGETARLDAALHFADPDGDALVFEASSSDPSVLDVMISSSTITVTPLGKGAASVAITASDPEGLEASQAFQVTVPNRRPEPVGVVPDQTIHVGQAVALDAAPYFSDPDGDALTLQASSSDPSVATVSVTASTATISALEKGAATVTITASDASGEEATQSFEVTVPNRRPEPVGVVPDQTIHVGQAIALDAAPYFTDPDGDALTLQASSSDPSVATVSTSGSTITMTALEKGATTITITASDTEELEATQAFEVTVPNRRPEPVGAIPDQSVFVSETATLDASAYFSDPDGDALIFQASSSDPSVTTVSTSGSTVTVTAGGEGSATATITASDPEGQQATQAFQVTVLSRNQAPAAVGVIAEHVLRVNETTTLDALPYFSDPDGDALVFQASSSDSSVATVYTSGTAVTITALQVGVAQITITAADPGGQEATQAFQITVSANTGGNRAPRAVGVIQAYLLRTTGTATLDAAPYFTDPDGDALTFQASSSDPSVASASASGSTVTITALLEGVAQVTITAADPGGQETTQAFQVTVSANTGGNQAPIAVGTISDQALGVGGTATLDAASYFTDPDGDALTFQASSSDPSVASASTSGTSVTITAHTRGVATVTITASDPSGLEASLTGSVTVSGVQPGPASLYLVQAVQTLQRSVPLVAGEPALLRVFVTAKGANSAQMPPVRATFYVGGSQVHQTMIAATSYPIPAAVDESSLSRSANAEIPGWVIQPGLEVVVEPDPNGTLDSTLAVARRIPATGRMAVEVRSTPALQLTIVPLLWEQDPDSSIIQTVAAVAADPDGHGLLKHTNAALPVSGINATAHAPVATRSRAMLDVLRVVDLIRIAEGSRGHYLGVMTNGIQGGQAYVAGRASYAALYSETIAHELGHNMNLDHAPCGSPSLPPLLDPRYPYGAGNIGAWGYDFSAGALIPPSHSDVMSYCFPQWISDYHFNVALRYRLAYPYRWTGVSGVSAPPASGRVLLVWGGLESPGLPTLRPSFFIDAPPTLPEGPGPWTLIGTDATGRELFSLSFAMSKVADTDNERADFAFAVPAAWRGKLARITLEGPDGSAILDHDTDRPMTILRDPVTRQIRGVLDGPPDAGAPSPFGVADTPGTRPRLQALFSRGIPDREALGHKGLP